jgi:hypothetical protein
MQRMWKQRKRTTGVQKVELDEVTKLELRRHSTQGRSVALAAGDRGAEGELLRPQQR